MVTSKRYGAWASSWYRMTTSALELVNVYKSIAGRPALTDLNLVVRRGEVYVLTGASGSGKTTALNISCGLSAPDHGRVLVFGRPPSGQFGRIGCALEPRTFFRQLTVMENLEIRARSLGIPRPARECRALAESLGITEYLRETVCTISTGVARCLEMGWALLGSPDVFVLDNPYAGLDPASRLRIETLVAALVDRRGAAALISTRDPETLRPIATRFGVLSQGTLVRELPARELADACTRTTYVRTDHIVRTLARLESQFGSSSISLDDRGCITVRGPELEAVSIALDAWPERVIELFEERHTLEELLDGRTEASHA